MKKLLSLLFLFFASSFSLFGQQKSSQTHTLYLVGDAGEPIIESSPLGNVLREMMRKETSPSTLVYLGDNAYPKGVPLSDGKRREEAETVLEIQASWIKDLDVKGIFIPGNHDWQKGNKLGWEHILNQQQFIDSLNQENITFLPRDGCPGPVEIPLTDNVLLVIIDSQWILHPWTKPFGDESPCDAKTGVELASLLNDIYARNEGKRIVMAAHHPLLTYGEHGGVYRFKDHIFPLTNLKSELYVPLPIVGSIYPLYRKWFGNVQDIANPLYEFYSSSIQNLLNEYPGNIHVAGHEHALEYIVKDSAHLVVSGSGSKTTYVKRKGYAQYAESVNGFVRIHFPESGDAIIQFIRVDPQAPNGEVTYTDTLPSIKRKSLPTDVTSNHFSGKVVARASENYQATRWRERMLGKNYRKEWHQALNVPVIDISHEKGGLSILKKGGGMQTLSLRLADSTGKEYTLRSVEKFPEAAVPEMLRKTFAQDLVQDQISASHPYGALIIPPMADAVGIYHTNPRLVYIPDDPKLGIYRKTFANTLALFEERPDGDWSEKTYFGNSKDIINTSKVISKLKKNNEDQVDQRFVVRSRLFDMVIGDWDRHDDQWRWATEEKKKGREIFRPIPRDRDQAFFVNQGILPRLWSRKWALPKFEGFQDEIQWPSGLSFNARYFDRTFLAGMTRQDWIDEAKAVQSGLTDQVIEDAVASWPEEIYKLSGPDVIRKLKSRRDHLVEYAISHYLFLAREVDVTGSDKNEVFDVERLDNGDVSVKIFATNKKGQPDDKVFERHFLYDETKEIRLFGFGGKDKFNLSGQSSKSILVRVIGGEDADAIVDSSRVKSFRKRTYFYDTKEASVIEPVANELRDMTSNDPQVNAYDRKSYQYNRLAPLIFGNFNVDDGLFIGGGFVYQTHGFRKDPFKQRHLVLASIAPRTSSYNFLYRGDFTEVVGKWNLEINADLKVPNFVNNFFGWGNESVFNQDIDEQPGINADEAIDYYRYRFEEIRLEAYLSRNIGNLAKVKIGPALQRIEIEEHGDEDRYVYDYAESLPYDLFTEYNSFTGVKWQFQLQQVDNPIVIRRGIRWNINGSSMKGIDEGAQDFNTFESDLSFYYTFQFPGRLTFALRTGGGINTGKYEFYQAQILDGRTELRGFRKTRFYGDSKFFTNMEVRLKLSSFNTYMFPVSFGILGFHDVGRVWYKDDNGVDPTAPSGESDVWHKSWGGGFWFTPFNMAVLSTELAHSDEGNLFYIRLGFLF